MAKRIKIGVAGAGHMGTNHIRALSELNGLFELVGVYDLDFKREKVAEDYGTDFYRSYEELLDDIDAIIISCPTSLHKEMALKAAEQMVNAFVEKPVAESLEDSAIMYDKFSDKDLVLGVGHIERFNPVMLALQEIVDPKEVVAIEVHRCSPFDIRIFDVDVISDLMIHDIDLVVNGICRKMPSSISAVGKSVVSGRLADYANVAMTFPDGILAFITSSRCTEEKIRTICIHAKDAYYEGDLLRRTLVIKRGVNYKEVPALDHIRYKQTSIHEQISLPNQEPLKAELIDFWKAIQEQKNMMVSGSQVIRAMKVLDTVKDKIYTGGLIK